MRVKDSKDIHFYWFIAAVVTINKMGPINMKILLDYWKICKDWKNLHLLIWISYGDLVRFEHLVTPWDFFAFFGLMITLPFTITNGYFDGFSSKIH